MNSKYFNCTFCQQQLIEHGVTIVGRSATPTIAKQMFRCWRHKNLIIDFHVEYSTQKLIEVIYHQDLYILKNVVGENPSVSLSVTQVELHKTDLLAEANLLTNTNIDPDNVNHWIEKLFKLRVFS